MVVAEEDLKVLNWLKLFGFEDGRVGSRVWHEVLGGEGANLRVWVGDEAHELVGCVSGVWGKWKSLAGYLPLLVR